jgi:hypothetical protein
LFAFACALLLRDILGYDVIHDKGHSLSSRQGMFQHRSGTTLLPPQYTTKPPEKSIREVE